MVIYCDAFTCMILCFLLFKSFFLSELVMICYKKYLGHREHFCTVVAKAQYNFFSVVRTKSRKYLAYGKITEIYELPHTGYNSLGKQ